MVMYRGDRHSVGATPQTQCCKKGGGGRNKRPGICGLGASVSFYDQEAWSPIQLFFFFLNNCHRTRSHL